MKKAPFILILVFTFIAEALACYFMLTRIKDIKTDPVKVNECMYSISENFGDTSKYNKQLDYAVIDNNGVLLYKTRDGLSESINEATTIRKMKEDDRASVLEMMRVFYASPAVLSNGSEEIFNNDIDLETCEFLMPDVLDKMIERKQANIKVLNTTAKWFGVTYKEDVDEFKKVLTKKINNGEYPNNLWSK